MAMNNATQWLESHITLHNNASLKEEKANAATHLAASIGALGYLLFVIFNHSRFQNASGFTAMIIFSLTQLLLFSSSTFYHWVKNQNMKRVGRIMDHLNIYLLIWGTYTPVLFFTGTSSARMLFYILTFFLFSGSFFTITFWGKLKPLHVILYLVMGWSLVFLWNDIVTALPEGIFSYVLAGGITYTLGVIFYAFKKIPYGHAVWHLFCAAASAMFSAGFLINFLA